MTTPYRVSVPVDLLDVAEFAGLPCWLSCDLVAPMRWVRADDDFDFGDATMENVRLYLDAGDALDADATALLLGTVHGTQTIRAILTERLVGQHHDNLICRAHEGRWL